MCVAVLFIIANIWKQPKCPRTEKCINKRWYIYTTEYYSAITNSEIMSFASQALFFYQRLGEFSNPYWSSCLRLRETGLGLAWKYQIKGKGTLFPAYVSYIPLIKICLWLCFMLTYENMATFSCEQLSSVICMDMVKTWMLLEIR